MRASNEHVDPSDDTSEPLRAARRTQRLLRVRDLTVRCYSQPLGIDVLAAEAAMSPAYFSRAFRRRLGAPRTSY